LTEIPSTRKRARALSACGCILGLVVAFADGPLQARPQQPQEASSAPDHLARGQSLLRTGKPREALSEFQEACRLDPSSARALILVGIAESQLGNNRGAVVALRHALQLDPVSEAAHYNLAMRLAQLQQNDDAIREFRLVLKLNPQSTSTHYNLGVLLEEKGDYEGALQNFLAVKKVQPGDAAVLLHLVSTYYGAGDSKQAVSLAQEVASHDLKGEFAVRLAQVMIRHNDFEQAIQLLEPVRSRAPTSSGVDMTLARAYLGARQPKRALNLLKAVQATDTSWQVEYLLGLAYVSDKQRQSAITAFRDAIRLNPDQPDAHYQLGKLLLNATDGTDQRAGVLELHRAIALDPHTSEYYEVLGRWFLQHDYLKSAIGVLDQGIKDGTATAELEAMMGLAQAALHGGASARPFAEKALQLDPQLALAHYLVGFCYFNAGNYMAAAEYYQQATKLDPRNDLYSYNTALVLQRLNRIDEALPYAQKSTALNPGRSLNHYFLGKLYTKLNRDPEAVRELEASIRLNPELDNSYYLLAQIYGRSGDTVRAQEIRDKLAGLKQAQQRQVQIESSESEPHEMISPSKVLQDHHQP
jgi:tetratricopeptide (TPR) repeat protein